MAPSTVWRSKRSVQLAVNSDSNSASAIKGNNGAHEVQYRRTKYACLSLLSSSAPTAWLPPALLSSDVSWGKTADICGATLPETPCKRSLNLCSLSSVDGVQGPGDRPIESNPVVEDDQDLVLCSVRGRFTSMGLSPGAWEIALVFEAAELISSGIVDRFETDRAELIDIEVVTGRFPSVHSTLLSRHALQGFSPHLMR